MNEAAHPEPCPRYKIQVEGQYRSRTGSKQGVEVREVWKEGCLFWQPWAAVEGNSVVLRIGGFGPFDAIVSSSIGGLTEATFLSPLYQPILEHIGQTHALRTTEWQGRDVRPRSPFDETLLNRGFS